MKNRGLLFVWRWLVCMLSVAGWANSSQAAWNDSIRYEGEVGAAFAGGQNTPFWLMSDKYGLSSRTRNNGYLRLGAFHDMDTAKRFTWGAGVDLAVAARFSSTFIVQQLYGEAKYRCLNLLVGSKNIQSPINNPEISSGNLLYSGNSRPIPQVRAGIFDYADVWGCRGWLGIKGYIAFGKFTDNNWIKDWVAPGSKYTLGTLYHSKELALRGGNRKKFPLEFEISLEMATQFGGTSYIGDRVVKMPHGFKDWIKAVIPMKGGETTPNGEQMNVQGNMLGTWNMVLSWNKPDWGVKLYYEHFYEDHSMLWIEYPWKDGLYGVEARFPKNRWVSAAVYEFLYLKDQSGAVYWDHTPEINEQVSGRDNYFNHYIYNGWQHWGMGIGTPFVIGPVYNNNHEMIFRSTRIITHHLGFKGNPCNEVGYRVLASYTRSWGTYNKPFPDVESNFNLLLEASYTPPKLKGWSGKLGLAMDAGSLLGNSYGAMITISKTGWIK